MIIQYNKTQITKKDASKDLNKIKNVSNKIFLQTHPTIQLVTLSLRFHKFFALRLELKPFFLHTLFQANDLVQV